MPDSPKVDNQAAVQQPHAQHLPDHARQAQSASSAPIDFRAAAVEIVARSRALLRDTEAQTKVPAILSGRGK